MKLLKFIFFSAGCGLAIGLPVYFQSHPFNSGDFIPHLIGIIGSAMMFIGATGYVIRKRVKAFKKVGKIKYWLEAHILFCLIGPLLVVYHSAFSIEAPNSGIAYYAMLIVVGSGVVGRYIYRHFQFSLSGERATRQEMSAEADQLNEKIQEYFSDSQKILDTITKFFGLRENQQSSGLFKSLYVMMHTDWLEGKLRKQVKQHLKQRKSVASPDSVESALVRRISLEKKISALEVTTRLFSYWHNLHVPFIWLLLLTFIVHVVAVMIF
ncbi:MAG: hypothetical protein HY036_01255 [Nitrospirae bacterium]|nr:hypothetical protein [Nitrospirota bacterium]MBI3351185.1 hypothetical protein [Nitrospirota bacterium]